MSGSARRPLFLLIAVVCAWGLILACKSGDDNAPTKTGASNGATSIGQATGSSDQSGDFAEAGADVSAFKLMDAAGYTAALGEPILGMEDDGVVPVDFGCEWGQARVLTHAGVVLTVGLHTAGNASDTAEIYRAFGNFGGSPTPIPGAGDQAGYVPGLAVVRKGTQVLVIAAQPGPDAQMQLDNIKITGGDPTLAMADMVAVASKVAPSLAAKIPGAGCPDSAALGIPAGGVNPCPMTAAHFGDAVGLPDAKAQPVMSDELPAQECIYSATGIGPVYTYVATHAILGASIFPTTAQDLFTKQQTQATNAQARGSGEYGTFSEPPFQAYGNIASPPKSIGIDSTILYQGDTSSARRLVPGPAHPALQVVEPVESVILRILESSSGLTITSLDQCEKMMKTWLDAVLGNGTASGPPAQVAQQYEDAKKALIDYCNKSVTTIDLSR